MMTMIKTSIYIKAARDTATITTMISTSKIDRQIPSQSLERAVRLILEENSFQFLK